MLKLKVQRKEKLNGGYSYYAPIVSTYKGKTSTYYLMINFKKGLEIRDREAIIEVKNFFFSSFTYNDETKLKMIITEYEKIGLIKNELENYNNEKEEYADFGDIELDDSQIAF